MTFLDLCAWGQAISGDKQRETNTLLALRGISNMSCTATGRRALVRDAQAVIQRVQQDGKWAEGGAAKWKMPAATVALK